MKGFCLALFLAVSVPCFASAQGLTPEQAGRLDAVFSDMQALDAPGASVAVIRRGQIIYSKGFGSAQIEYQVPITPTTVFHVASVSKQFTAMAVLLLVVDGKLGLDDDIREHMPDVSDMGAVVTPRHLLHHVSGVRDQWELLAMAGWRLDDVITKEHVRRLLLLQEELNFEPGAEYMYSNMGFSLAADLVERVAGMPFSEFVDERIFQPLEMHLTHVHDDHEMVVPNRAYSYRETQDGYRNAVLSYANHGATSLFTTAEDLVNWLDNFRVQTVGGPAVLEEMTTRGVLNNGDTIPYALGIGWGDYRGLRNLGHGGSDAGFRSQVMWFPDHNVGIAVLSNFGSANPGLRARQVADVVLGDVLEPAPEPAEAAIAPESEQDQAPVQSNVDLSQFLGTYYSPEIETFYQVREVESGLVVYHLRFGEIRLVSGPDDDTFLGGQWFLNSLAFTRDAASRVDGFRLTGGRVRNLRFVKVATPLPRE
jgi:CubicO group peptidase (beta-lactamase class C family)